MRLTMIGAGWLLVTSTGTGLAQGSGADLVKRYGEAIGGDAVMRFKSIRTTGKVEMAAMGLTGSMVTVNAAPNKIAVIMEFPGLGTISQVFDGTHAWSVDPMQGPRLLQGSERARLEEDAGIAGVLRRSAAITGADVVGDSTVGGGTCTWVKISYRSGRSGTECYDHATGLMSASKSVQESPMGSMATSSTMSDWKAFGPLKSATKMTMQAAGMTQTMSVTSIEFDRADDAEVFAMPDAIKALVVGRP